MSLRRSARGKRPSSGDVDAPPADKHIETDAEVFRLHECADAGADRISWNQAG